MRKGINPAKEENSIVSGYYHRVIMPVHIPNLEGYFSKSAEVLELSLKSLIASVHPHVAITVINNNSCREVTSIIDRYHRNGSIQCVVNNRTNTSKIDSMMSVARGSYEPVITFTDADVLFEDGWIAAVEEVFVKCRTVGFVSPCPIPKLWNYATTTTIISQFLKIRQSRILSKGKLALFPKSVGNEDMYSDAPYLLTKQFYFEKNGLKLVLGAGHFVASIRREMLAFSPKQASKLKLAGRTMRTYIDFPIDEAGFLRVGTSGIFAHHMGNIPETWMISLAGKSNDVVQSLYSINDFKKPLPHFFVAWMGYRLRNLIILIIFKVGLLKLFSIKK